MHARAVRVEDARDLDLHPVLAVVIHEQGFGTALAFVVAGADTDRVHAAPVTFRLWMYFGIAIHFRCRRLHDFRAGAFRQAEHVDRAVHAGFRGLHRVVLVMNRRRRAGEVVYFIDLDIQRHRHVVAQQLEARVRHQMQNVLLGAGEEIIQTDDLVAFVQQALAQMRTEETAATRDQNFFHTRLPRPMPI